MYFRFSSVALIGLVLLAGCGPQNKSVLYKLNPGLTKKEVVSEIGKPDDVQIPELDGKGNRIDVWEYCLANVDNRGVLSKVGGWLVFWEKPTHNYNMYTLKFVNNYLTTWENRGEIASLYRVKETNKVRTSLIS